MTQRCADYLHAGLMLLVALGTLAYWAIYFSSGATHVREDAIYLAFENAFPLADAWMASCYLLSAWFFLRGAAPAILWGLCAGSAMIFLAAMDFLFDLEQGQFHAAMPAEMWLEIIIVVTCWIVGGFTIWRCWQHPLRRQ